MKEGLLYWYILAIDSLTYMPTDCHWFKKTGIGLLYIYIYRLIDLKRLPKVYRQVIQGLPFPEIGNPRGNENPFLLTFDILWFRWHNLIARYLAQHNTNWSGE